MPESTSDPPGNENGVALQSDAESCEYKHEYLPRLSIIFGSPSSLITIEISEASASVQILCRRDEAKGVLGDLERKLLRLALDKGAAIGEIRNSAVKLIESWRSRGICVEDFEENGTLLIDSYGSQIVGFGKYACERIGDCPSDYLGWMVDTPGIREKHPDVVRAALAVLKRRGMR
jgi:hypothetical protein